MLKIEELIKKREISIKEFNDLTNTIIILVECGIIDEILLTFKESLKELEKRIKHYDRKLINK